MDTTPIVLDRAKARELWRSYRSHVHYSTPIDDEIRRVYELTGQGRVVIRALDSIRDAGLNTEGLPKLAIARADGRSCYLRSATAAAIFPINERAGNERNNTHWSRRIVVPWPG